MEELVKNHSGQQLYYQGTGGTKANTITTSSRSQWPGRFENKQVVLTLPQRRNEGHMIFLSGKILRISED